MEHCFMLVPKRTAALGPVRKAPLSAKPRRSSDCELKRYNKKPRAKLACLTCRARKVRCDLDRQSPCSNCRAYGIECETVSGRKRHTRTSSDAKEPRTSSQSRNPESSNDRGTANLLTAAQDIQFSINHNNHAEPYRSILFPETENGCAVSWVPLRISSGDLSSHPQKITYWGESSGFYPLTIEDIQSNTTELVSSREEDLTNAEYKFLEDQGAFSLPPRSVCEELIDAYFIWISPVIPVINKHDFMRKFRSTEQPPSYLLMQSLMLAACRVCRCSFLLDADGSTKTVSKSFYKRAKALYDANYESDQLTIIQALVLLGWYWEGPEGFMDNSFYWTQVAVAVAQGSGMHRRVHDTSLPETDKRLWKRIWWTLFTRDHTLALARGRPFSIQTEDTDVEALAEEDFIEEDTGAARFPCDRPVIKFFLHFTELCKTIGVILKQRHLFSAKPVSSSSITRSQCYTMLQSWYQKLPEQFHWDPSSHEFWPSVLQLYYYSALCILHLSPTYKGTSSIAAPDVSRAKPRYFSSASTDASMISCILGKLRAFGQITYVPCFTAYSSCVAMAIHANEILRSTDECTECTHHSQIAICMNALKDLSRSWLLAEASFNAASPIVDQLIPGDWQPLQL